MWHEAQPRTPPRLFDGDAVPPLAAAPDFAALAPGGPEPIVLLGEAVDVTARSARLTLSRAPGRNLAVLGSQATEACAVLGAAAASLGRQFRPGESRISIACLDPDAYDAARATATDLAADWYDQDSVADLLAATAADLGRTAGSRTAGAGPHFIFLYAADAAAGRLAVKGPGGSGHDHLRRILHGGPERRTHVLAGGAACPGCATTWAGSAPASTRSARGWRSTSTVSDLNPLSPQPSGVQWYPRPWRGLYFNRARHRAPEVLIPYEL
jgi:hypothetical protein